MKSKTQNHPKQPSDQSLDVQLDCPLKYDELKAFLSYSSTSPETLALNFPKEWQGTSWTKLFESERAEGTLSTNFLKVWKEKLENLQNLEMELPIIKKSNESLEKLLLPLFKALPALKSFKCNPKTVEDNDAEDKDYDEKIGAFPYDILDFTRFMDCLEEKKELEIFEMNYQEDEDPLARPRSTIKFHPKKQYYLAENLERVSLRFKFFKDFDFHSFFGILLANHGSIKDVKLSMIYFDCPDALNGFLRLIDERLSESENMKLDLEISLYIDNLDKIFCYFNEPIILNKQQVAVKLNVILKPPFGTPTIKMTDEIKDDFGRIFGNFQYNFIEFKLYNESSGPFAYKYHIRSRSS